MPAGLYLHYPYCKKKCHYCDFVSFVNLNDRFGYTDYLMKEWALYRNEWAPASFDTLYFGGGTPSLLPTKEWSILSQWISDELSGIDEFTVEANPESVDHELMNAIEKAGCTRMSLGIQSINDQILRLIGRIHSSSDAYKAVERAKKSRIKQINLDFIVGLPGETWDSVEQNCHFIHTFHPHHLSLYFLSIPSTSIMQKLAQVDPSLFPDEATVLSFWKYYIEFLHDLGYQHYEISNFSLPGCESRHNSHYWNRDPYLGLGINASSFYNKKRWTNTSSIALYQNNVAHQKKPVAYQETLSVNEIYLETVMLGFRQFNVGVAADFFPIHTQTTLHEMQEKGWLILKNTRYCLTESGCVWLDTIIKQLT